MPEQKKPDLKVVEKKSYDRCSDEPQEAFDAFEVYAALDPSFRSMERAYQAYLLKIGKEHTTQVHHEHKGWFNQFGWSKRVKELDKDRESIKSKDIEFLKECVDDVKQFIIINKNLVSLAYEALEERIKAGQVSAATLVNMIRNAQEEYRTNTAYVANIGIEQTQDDMGGIEITDGETGEKFI